MSKTIKIFIPIFLSFILIYSYVTPFIKTSESISQEVFRLHILANSDSDEDQSLKLKVRDKILTKSESLFINCKNLNDVINVSKNNMSDIEVADINTTYDGEEHTITSLNICSMDLQMAY